MIFLTVGTHEPFDRLVRAVDEWCGSVSNPPEILGQITDRADYTPRHFPSVAALAPADYGQRFAQARAIISHAGMGSIITALSQQKPILVLPRRGHLNETRNDHQFSTVQRFKGRPGIFVAEDEAALPAAMETLQSAQAGQGDALSPYAGDDLIEALRGFIHGGSAPDQGKDS